MISFLDPKLSKADLLHPGRHLRGTSSHIVRAQWVSGCCGRESWLQHYRPVLRTTHAALCSWPKDFTSRWEHQMWNVCPPVAPAQHLWVVSALQVASQGTERSVRMHCVAVMGTVRSSANKMTCVGKSWSPEDSLGTVASTEIVLLV